jgi:hypothetical protein
MRNQSCVRHHQKFWKTKVNSRFLWIFLLCLWHSILLGCTKETPIQDFQAAQPTLTPFSTLAPSPSTTPSMTHKSLPKTGGPFLLIQSGFTDYAILDISTGDSTPVNLPGSKGTINLNANASPSNQRMFFFVEEGKIAVSDLTTGQIISTQSLIPGDPLFQADAVLESARAAFPETDYLDAELLNLIQKAYDQSITDIRWYQSDRYWLLPRAASPTSTNLSLYDHETKTYQQLDEQPGLVLDYLVGPNGDHILLKKGIINEPRFWEDKQYFVINTYSGTTQAFKLPEFVDNPRLFWIQTNKIGIIHQMRPVGGVDFSIYDLENDETNLVIKGSFTHISQYKDGLFSIMVNQDKTTTILALTSFLEVTSKQQTINRRCQYKARMGDLILLNCETESLLVDEDLSVTPFDEPVAIIAPSSDNAILVTRAGETFLLNMTTLERQPLILEGPPLEIRWLPDLSGFLYRTGGNLYIYNLAKEDNRLLISSEIFGDYTNINAVWINLD